LLWKNWLKQQLLIEYFGDDQSSEGKEGLHQKEKNHQMQNKDSQLKIDNNPKNEKIIYTEVEK
jgi:hypothetical protein